MGVKIKGLASLQAKFKKLDPVTKAAMGKGVNKATLKVEGDAKLIVAVDTGELRGSIHSEVSEDSSSVTGSVGTNKEHGVFNEFGTSKMAAQPFLQPALQKNKKTATKIVLDEIRAAYKGM